ncbi:MAG TPA: lysine--tRNA ligase [Verrucomicrobiales bacterium]|nr:lysine--tRNA ligase [Verrucomicrobiales bacterium]
MDDKATERDLYQTRLEKLGRLRELGVHGYGGRFDATHEPGGLHDHFTENLPVRLAGRIVAHRDMGKSHFFDIADASGRIQCFLNAPGVGAEAFEIFRLLDLGDWIGVEGETFRTRVGEPSVRVDRFTLLSKALRPLPDKWHGLTEKEIRYRQRYLDLIANPESRRLFYLRSAIVAGIRRFMHERGFIEVETPMLQTIPGGAAARPFSTHHHALDLTLYLRIAPELYLKRLLVGGFTKVFELNRNFRNEGISRRHNPEFTMLEAYQACADFEQMAELVEELICGLAETFSGGLQIEHKNEDGEILRVLDLRRPWKRRTYRDLIMEIDPQWFDYTPEQRRQRCAELGVDAGECREDIEVTQQVFEKLVEEKTFDPLFVTSLPRELVPLARENPADSSVVEVYELIINGQEISPGYSELNDPVAQRRRLEDQAGEEAQKLDEDFLLALEHGMPPAGGIGLGIDRLIMLLTGAESIRDVLLFPHMRPRE